MKARVKFLSTFMKNHSVSADILAARHSDAKMVCDLANLELRKRPVTVRNIDIKGAVETSPGRRRALRAYFEARDRARSLNPSPVFEECARSLGVWDSSACMRLGYVDRKAEEWVWDNIACATVGIKIPADISGDECAEGNVTPAPEAEPQPGGAPQRDEPAVNVDAMDPEQTEVIDVDNNSEGGDSTKRAATPTKQDENTATKKQRTLARSSTS